MRLRNGATLVAYLKLCQTALTTLLPSLTFKNRLKVDDIRGRLSRYLDKPKGFTADPAVYLATILAYAPALDDCKTGRSTLSHALRRMLGMSVEAQAFEIR